MTDADRENLRHPKCKVPVNGRKCGWIATYVKNSNPPDFYCGAHVPSEEDAIVYHAGSEIPLPDSIFTFY